MMNRISEAIQLAVERQDLSYAMAEEVMDEIMDGQATAIQMAAYLTAMSLKGETITEITASAAGLRKHCVRLLNDMAVLEIVGTGGDHANSFNISTTSALVISAAGVPVAKHGNRAASSRSGSADVLEALGVNIDVSAKKSLETLSTIGLCFLYAQNYHLAMKYVSPVRRELGIRTIFNILGPLVNPAGATMELLGVYDEDLVEPLAKVLHNLGVTNAMVVHGRDGLDEISMCATTAVCEVRGDEFRMYTLDPVKYGFALCSPKDLVGGTPSQNADITRAIVNGEVGPKTDAVVMNSAAALYLARDDLSLSDAVQVALETITSGKAAAQLDAFIRLTND
ncbi:MAG: anthranilate phosphoribosyltransferase [Propionibacteriaceae bacterium]|jgi:anthranilate phosphoribosyltransferase|nr:anthranilate phosphoribosyltransferase [Propionibacteriaceae bacterium]